MNKIKSILKSNKFKLFFNMIVFVLILLYTLTLSANFIDNINSRNSNGTLADRNREQYNKILEETAELRNDKIVSLYKYGMININGDSTDDKIVLKSNYSAINKKLIFNLLNNEIKDKIKINGNDYQINELDIDNLGDDTKLTVGILNNFKDISKEDIDENSAYIKIKYYKQLDETASILKDTYKKHDLDTTLYSLKATFNFIMIAVFIYIEKYILRYIIKLRKEAL